MPLEKPAQERAIGAPSRKEDQLTIFLLKPPAGTTIQQLLDALNQLATSKKPNGGSAGFVKKCAESAAETLQVLKEAHSAKSSYASFYGASVLGFCKAAAMESLGNSESAQKYYHATEKLIDAASLLANADTCSSIPATHKWATMSLASARGILLDKKSGAETLFATVLEACPEKSRSEFLDAEVGLEKACTKADGLLKLVSQFESVENLKSHGLIGAKSAKSVVAGLNEARQLFEYGRVGEGTQKLYAASLSASNYVSYGKLELLEKDMAAMGKGGAYAAFEKERKELLENVGKELDEQEFAKVHVRYASLISKVDIAIGAVKLWKTSNDRKTPGDGLRKGGFYSGAAGAETSKQAKLAVDGAASGDFKKASDALVAGGKADKADVSALNRGIQNRAEAERKKKDEEWQKAVVGKVDDVMRGVERFVDSQHIKLARETIGGMVEQCANLKEALAKRDEKKANVAIAAINKLNRNFYDELKVRAGREFLISCREQLRRVMPKVENQTDKAIIRLMDNCERWQNDRNVCRNILNPTNMKTFGRLIAVLSDMPGETAYSKLRAILNVDPYAAVVDAFNTKFEQSVRGNAAFQPFKLVEVSPELNKLFNSERVRVNVEAFVNREWGAAIGQGLAISVLFAADIAAAVPSFGASLAAAPALLTAVNVGATAARAYYVGSAALSLDKGLSEKGRAYLKTPNGRMNIISLVAIGPALPIRGYSYVKAAAGVVGAGVEVVDTAKIIGQLRAGKFPEGVTRGDAISMLAQNLADIVIFPIEGARGLGESAFVRAKVGEAANAAKSFGVRTGGLVRDFGAIGRATLGELLNPNVARRFLAEQDGTTTLYQGLDAVRPFSRQVRAEFAERRTKAHEPETVGLGQVKLEEAKNIINEVNRAPSPSLGTSVDANPYPI